MSFPDLSSRSSTSSEVLQVESQQPEKSVVFSVGRPPNCLVQFFDGSSLQKYLVEKVPHLVSSDRKTYQLHQVLRALRVAIIQTSLFDPRNPSIVMCDSELEEILGARALHTTEVRDRLWKHLEQVRIDEVAASAIPVTTASDLPPDTCPASSTDSQVLLGGRSAEPDVTGIRPSVSGMNASPVRESFVCDSMFLVDPAFLKVVRTLTDVDPGRTVFSYRELTSYLSRYILANKDRLFDARNHMVVICRGDLLGQAFGVEAFHRSQVAHLLMRRLIKVPLQAMEHVPVNSLKRQQHPHPVPDSSTEPSSDAPNKSKKQRGISVSFEVDYSSDESNGSKHEEGGEMEKDFSESDEELRVFAFEGVYSGEFEPSGGESEGESVGDPSTSGHSDFEDVVLWASVVFNNDTDIAVWADSSDSSDGDSDFALSNYDPETGSETWKCVSCLTPNTPYIRYCGRCWQERKGWVADRANPRKKRQRKGKRTDGLSVKKSSSVVAVSAQRIASLSPDGRCTATSDSGDSGGSQPIQEPSASDPTMRLATRGEECGKNQGMMCTFCCCRPKDASFIHGRISHQVCCYQCARKLFKEKRPCPLCRRKIEKITKHIVG